MAGSIESPELANSLALRLPASRLGGPWKDLGPPPGALPRIPAYTTVLFFLEYSAVLSFLRFAGATCKVDKALIKASSSCLGCQNVLLFWLLFAGLVCHWLVHPVGGRGLLNKSCLPELKGAVLVNKTEMEGHENACLSGP
jgi:hypothetical protein